jgi:CRISPR-associated protein NE0113 (Cas_NE0113)
MGVYHLMGLGLSPGAVTGPISYLAEIYNNWEDEGQYFFSRSGEEEQRKKGDKVGDIQAIILFATREVIDGRDRNFYAEKYVKNRLGQIDTKLEKPEPMKKLLESLLKEEWSKISGRKTGCIFWCEVERRGSKEILKEQTFKRVAQVVASLAKGTGAQGKEIWMNLTGGNNVINFALQLAASLSGGEVGRLYYVQAANEMAEKCVCYTNKETYWVELPVMPLVMSDLNHEILNFLAGEEAIKDEELYNRLKNQHWHLVQYFQSPQEFKEKCLRSMKKIGFISVEKDTGTCRVGSQWELIQQYEKIMQDALDKAKREGLNIEKLEEKEDWLTMQEIKLN